MEKIRQRQTLSCYPEDKAATVQWKGHVARAWGGLWELTMVPG